MPLLQYIDYAAYLPAGNSAYDVWAGNLNNNIFVANRGIGLSVLQFSATGTLSYRASVITRADPHISGVSGDDNFQYLVDDWDGDIISFTTPPVGESVIVDTINGGAPRKIWADNLGHIFVGSFGGLKIYDISITGLITLNSTPYGGINFDICGCESYIFSARSSSGVYVYSWLESMPGLDDYSLTLLSSAVTPQIAVSVWGSNSWVCVGSQSSGWPQTGSIYVYSHVNGILTYKSTTAMPRPVVAIAGNGNYIYSSCKDSGIYLHQINPDGTLTQIAQDYQAGGNYGRSTMSSGFLFITNVGNGVYSYKVGMAPTSLFYGPLVGCFGGPV